MEGSHQIGRMADWRAFRLFYVIDQCKHPQWRTCSVSDFHGHCENFSSCNRDLVQTTHIFDTHDVQCLQDLMRRKIRRWPVITWDGIRPERSNFGAVCGKPLSWTVAKTREVQIGCGIYCTNRPQCIAPILTPTRVHQYIGAVRNSAVLHFPIQKILHTDLFQ